jgi:flagellar biosynthesis/type III secretory pathway protein FliH
MPEFRTLASLFARIEEPASEKPAEQQTIEIADSAYENAKLVETALSGARLLRAHLRELADEALAALLADIASEVVGRELRLQPVDLRNIISAAVERYRFETPLRVRVHPEDAADLDDIALDVICDQVLRRGDAILELRGGAIDLTLGVRLERLLQRNR